MVQDTRAVRHRHYISQDHDLNDAESPWKGQTTLHLLCFQLPPGWKTKVLSKKREDHSVLFTVRSPIVGFITWWTIGSFYCKKQGWNRNEVNPKKEKQPGVFFLFISSVVTPCFVLSFSLLVKAEELQTVTGWFKHVSLIRLTCSKDLTFKVKLLSVKRVHTIPILFIYFQSTIFLICIFDQVIT